MTGTTSSIASPDLCHWRVCFITSVFVTGKRCNKHGMVDLHLHFAEEVRVALPGKAGSRQNETATGVGIPRWSCSANTRNLKRAVKLLFETTASVEQLHCLAFS